MDIGDKPTTTDDLVEEVKNENITTEPPPTTTRKNIRKKQLSALKSRIDRCARKRGDDLENVRKLKIETHRYNTLKNDGVQLSYVEAEDVIFGQKLQLQDRYMTYLGMKGVNTVTTRCPLCETRKVTVFRSNIVEVTTINALLFACDACVTTLVRKTAGMRKRRSQSIEDSRAKVWLKTFGVSLQAKCLICGVEELTCASSSWHICHIQSKATGGQDAIENLIAGCSTCNLAMGTKSVITHFNSLNNYDTVTDLFRKIAINDTEVLDFVYKSLD